MQIASNAFAEAVKEVYETSWSERDKLVSLYEVCIKTFLNMLFLISLLLIYKYMCSTIAFQYYNNCIIVVVYF